MVSTTQELDSAYSEQLTSSPETDRGKNSAGRRFWNADTTMTPAAEELYGAAFATRPFDDNLLDLTLLISCFNEADYIAETLDTVCSAARETGRSFELIVIDDCSKDSSAEIVREYIASHPAEAIILRVNQHNKGLAQNYFDAAYLGKGKYYRLICGDNSEPKESIAAVLRAIGEADCIVPYFLRNERKSFLRQLISKSFTLLINSISGHRIQYYNGLAVHWRHNVMRWHPNTSGFGFQAELLCRLVDLGCTYKEVPIVAIEKRRGRSNALSWRNCLSVLHSVSEITIRRISNIVYRHSN